MDPFRKLDDRCWTAADASHEAKTAAPLESERELWKGSAIFRKNCVPTEIGLYLSARSPVLLLRPNSHHVPTKRPHCSVAELHRAPSPRPRRRPRRFDTSCVRTIAAA